VKIGRELDKVAVCRRSVLLIQRVPYQGSSWRVWRLQNRRTSNSHCEICRWPCATG
jgi:hypothetical protein